MLISLFSQIDAETRPSALGPPFTGHFRVLLDMPRGLQPLHPGTKALKQQQQAAAQSSSSSSRPTTANLPLRTSIYSTSADGKSAQAVSETQAAQLVTKANGDTSMQDGDENGEGISYTCDTCGTDCSTCRYHSRRRTSKPDGGETRYDICPNCYTEGRFPSNLFSGDFLRIDNRTSYRKIDTEGTNSQWTDQETLLLLEGLEMYNDDWDKISEHIKTRSREECISQFLQLPIEDEFLVNEGGLGAGSNSSISGQLGRVDKLPFSQPEHPVLSVVAFLASVVDPEVAAKAASESVKELSAQLKKKADQAPAENEGERSDGAVKSSAEEGENGAEQKDSDMAVDGEKAKDTSSTESGNKNQLHRSASLALGSAAAKAHLLAQQTSADLTSQIHQLVSSQVTKLSLKISQFEMLESSLDNERRQIEMAKQLLQMERLGIEKQIEAISEISKKVASGEASNNAAAAGAGGGIQQADIERLRMMGNPSSAQNSTGVYRSGMQPMTSLVQGSQPPLHQNGTFANIE
jgi:SWI/SNF related-matrix-associated actin-dependent regulator of chromatin subfamily C